MSEERNIIDMEENAVEDQNQSQQETAEQFEDSIRKNKTKLSEHDRIKLLVVRVCEDTPSTFAVTIRKLVDQIIEYAQKPEKLEYTETLLRYFVDAVSLLPLKQPVYATVLALVLLKSKEVFDSFLKRITDQLQKTLASGDRLKAKNLLVVLGELVNIGVLNCYSFEQLISSIIDECSSSESQSQREYYLSIVLSSLLCVQGTLLQKISAEYNQLLSKLKNLIEKRDTSYITLLSSRNQSIDILSVQWQVLNSAASGDNEEENQGNYENDLSIWQVKNEFEKELKNIPQAEWSVSLDLKQSTSNAISYQSPLFLSAIVALNETVEDEDDDSKANKNTLQLTISRLTALQGIQEILSLFCESKKNLLQQLQTVYRVSANSLWVYKLIIDQLLSQGISPKSTTASTQRSLVYSSIFNSMVPLNKDTAFEVLIQAYNYYYSALSEYPVDLSENLAEFLSHVLSERHLQFPWETVTFKQFPNEEINTDAISVTADPQVLFWRDVIFRLCQLCGRDKVKVALQKPQTITEKINNALSADEASGAATSSPASLNPILDGFLTKPTVKETISTRYQDEPQTKKFMEKLVQKKTSEELVQEITGILSDKQQIDEEADEGEEPESEEERIQHVLSAFIESLLVRSCETVTHLKILYERYTILLNTLNESYNKVFQKSLVSTLLSFWRHSSFHLNLYLHKFADAGLLTDDLVVSAIFEQVQSADDRHVHQLWSFLRRLAADATDTHFNQIRNQKEQENTNNKNTSDALEVTGPLNDLLTLIFNSFASALESSDNEQQQQYVQPFLFFFRKYSRILQWNKEFASVFSNLQVPQNVLNSYIA